MNKVNIWLNHTPQQTLINWYLNSVWRAKELYNWDMGRIHSNMTFLVFSLQLPGMARAVTLVRHKAWCPHSWGWEVTVGTLALFSMSLLEVLKLSVHNERMQVILYFRKSQSMCIFYSIFLKGQYTTDHLSVILPCLGIICTLWRQFSWFNSQLLIKEDDMY